MGAPAPPRRRKKFLGVIYREKFVSSPPADQVHTQAEQGSILGHFLLCGVDMELQLVVLDRLLKMTTKKVVNFF